MTALADGAARLGLDGRRVGEAAAGRAVGGMCIPHSPPHPGSWSPRAQGPTLPPLRHRAALPGQLVEEQRQEQERAMCGGAKLQCSGVCAEPTGL